MAAWSETFARRIRRWQGNRPIDTAAPPPATSATRRPPPLPIRNGRNGAGDRGGVALLAGAGVLLLGNEPQAERAALAAAAAPVEPADLAAYFKGSRTKKRVADLQAILETLSALSQATEPEDGRLLAV